ncbi:MAG TPA: chromosome segregation protein ScpA [Desulfobacterales bacterium]|nr:chromosome segregation protein ScpA [Desulfobacterales bacterium]
MEYQVQLEIFEGPLDLLLHLIHKNEVDIFDIPIATITDQYLEYLKMMKALNINVAADFLVMASTLLYIKSKMLLPNAFEEEEEEDPRMEITRPLLEYMRLKGVAQELWDREILQRDVFTRPPDPNLYKELKQETPELDVNIFQLMEAFKAIMEGKAIETKLKFKPLKWSLKEKAAHIVSRLRKGGSLYFKELFVNLEDMAEFIVTFLALLELVHTGVVKVFQPDPQSDIKLTPTFMGKPGVDNGTKAPQAHN